MLIVILVLIKNHPYHKAITNHQNTIIAKEVAGKDVCVVEFPIPPGNIYPPETREEFEKSISSSIISPDNIKLG